jgi:cephalosporin hydroxylase
MLKKLIRDSAFLLAPRWAASVEERRWLQKQARLLHQQCAACKTIEMKVDTVLANKFVIANQKRSEIIKLLRLVEALRPERLCEIGTAQGGTLFLFCQVAAPNARILSLDLGHQAPQMRAYPTFARPGQAITCLAADSHAPATLAKVREWLGGKPLDFLFIDGDHSFQGVDSDYRMFAPLVRPGGLVAFHDIVPDSRTRYGIVTGPSVGDVPVWWTGIKNRHPNVQEFIQDPEQDGYGIGLLEWDGRCV